MAQTGIIWSGESGHLKIGLNVRWDDIGAATTQSHVYVDWYYQTVAWGFSDPQRLNFNGSLGGYWDYTCSSGSGATVTALIGTYDIGVQGTSYSGGPTWTFGAYVSGAYNGAAPSISYVWSLPARPASAPSAPGVGVDTVTNNSARIVVYASADNGSPIDWYGAWVATDSAFTNVVASATGGTFTATGLAPATTYYARAQSHNGVGYSAYSNTASFTTGATVPGAPTSVTASSVAQTTATMSWTAPSNGGSAITSYTTEIATNSAFSAGVRDFTSTTTSVNLTGLTPGTTYYTRVRAVNGVGAGAWSAQGSFTTLAGTPVVVSPTASQVMTDGYLNVTVSAQGIVANVSKITVEVSQSSSFSSGVLSKDYTPSSVSGNGQYTITDTTKYMVSGTWYVRAKVTDTSTSYVTPYSSTVTFSESHTPATTLLSPSTGVTMQYQSSTSLSFKFSDSSSVDHISAYRVVIENNSTGASIYDSGKTAYTTGSTVTVTRAILSSLKNVPLRWRAMTWDAGDTASAWTGYNVFTLSDPPSVALVTPPSGLPVDNGSPTFSWTFNSPGGGSQASATLTVVDSASGSQVWATTIVGTDTSVTPSTVVLLNTHSYLATLSVTDSLGLTGTTSSNFSASYSAPGVIRYSADASGVDSVGYVEVDWSDADPDSQFISWKVYRQELGTPEWDLIATITNQNQRTYEDYMVVAGTTYLYSVTQTANRSGAELESPVGYVLTPDGSGGYNVVSESNTFFIDLQAYWIINLDTPSTSVRLSNVVSDDSTLEFEQEAYTIIGRGRHVDYGDELGYNGELKVQVRGVERPSSMRANLEALRRAKETYYIRTPFGRTFQVALGNIGWSPLKGTGTSEMGDMSIPYLQVN